jgi:hypothetical protein
MTQIQQQEQVSLLVASAIQDLAGTQTNSKVDKVKMQCLLSEKSVRESEELHRRQEELCQGGGTGMRRSLPGEENISWMSGSVSSRVYELCPKI